MSFNFMAAVTICSDLEPPKIKSDTVSTVSPSICHEVMGPDSEGGSVTDFLLALKSLQMMTAAMKSEDDFFLAGKLWQI